MKIDGNEVGIVFVHCFVSKVSFFLFAPRFCKIVCAVTKQRQFAFPFCSDMRFGFLPIRYVKSIEYDRNLLLPRHAFVLLLQLHDGFC